MVVVQLLSRVWLCDYHPNNSTYLSLIWEISQAKPISWDLHDYMSKTHNLCHSLSISPRLSYSRTLLWINFLISLFLNNIYLSSTPSHTHPLHIHKPISLYHNHLTSCWRRIFLLGFQTNPGQHLWHTHLMKSILFFFLSYQHSPFETLGFPLMIHLHFRVW